MQLLANARSITILTILIVKNTNLSIRLKAYNINDCIYQPTAVSTAPFAGSTAPSSAPSGDGCFFSGQRGVAIYRCPSARTFAKTTCQYSAGRKPDFPAFKRYLKTTFQSKGLSDLLLRPELRQPVPQLFFPQLAQPRPLCLVADRWPALSGSGSLACFIW